MLNRGFVIKDGILERYRGWRRKIIIPKEVRIIGGWAFAYNQRITTVIIHDGVTKIEEGAFAECQNLTSVTIPDSVKEIEGWTFRLCQKLCDISLSENMVLGEDVLRGCKCLADENGFVSFKNILYGYFGNKKNIVVPNDISKISGWAFYENESLSQVIIPYGVNEIGYDAFRSCPNLTHIHIPVSLTKIADTAFFESDKIVIHASMGSYTEQYAKENNIPFVAE